MKKIKKCNHDYSIVVIIGVKKIINNIPIFENGVQCANCEKLLGKLG